ncbi:CrcB family protein [Actinomadura sp. GC306]|nr:CrcB family protein [Actinomadura sp. GC306]
MSGEDAHGTVGPENARRVSWTTLAAVSVGGVLGSLARYQITVAFPHRPDAFGWATWSINVSGCLLIGVLMVAITEVRRAHRLVRPFLGVGVLGGFTTFSTHVIEAQRAMDAGAAGTGMLYLAATLAGGLAAVYTGAKLTRLAVRRA